MFALQSAPINQPTNQCDQMSRLFFNIWPLAPGRFFDGRFFDGRFFDGHIFDGHFFDQ